MGWKEFFYFSKGERRALTLLLFIIAVALVLLLFKGRYLPDSPEPPAVDIKPGFTAQDTTSTSVSTKPETDEPKPVKAPRQASSAKEKYSLNPRFNKSASAFSQKYAKGTLVELNTADTLVLKKVPGIGSVFARRIVKYRELLGGYASVEQLREVYGIDEEKFQALHVWFNVGTTPVRKLAVNHLSLDDLARHPYLNYKQARVIVDLRQRKGRLTGWQNLDLLDEFTNSDKKRLTPYFSFE